MKKVTIHQPDFMPWLGLFYKIYISDVFVILDHVEMDVKNSAWLKRVKFFLNNKVEWVSIPLVRPKEGHMLRIQNIEVAIENKEFNKKKNQIVNQYRKHPYYSEIEPIINKYFSKDSNLVCEKNIEFIKDIIERLDIDTKIIRSSTLNISTSKNQMNIDIVKKINGGVYISGMGADGYQISSDFEKQRLMLEYSNFNADHYKYPQKNAKVFESGLSVVDALMNLGFNGVSKLLREQKL